MSMNNNCYYECALARTWHSSDGSLACTKLYNDSVHAALWQAKQKQNKWYNKDLRRVTILTNLLERWITTMVDLGRKTVSRKYYYLHKMWNNLCRIYKITFEKKRIHYVQTESAKITLYDNLLIMCAKMAAPQPRHVYTYRTERYMWSNNDKYFGRQISIF